MKTKLLFPLLLAVSVPTIAQASMALDQINRAIRQPLAASEAPAQTPATAKEDNTSGQSAAMSRALYTIAENTQHATDHPVDGKAASIPARPLDW